MRHVIINQHLSNSIDAVCHTACYIVSMLAVDVLSGSSPPPPLASRRRAVLRNAEQPDLGARWFDLMKIP